MTTLKSRIKGIQQHLEIPADGEIGPQTIGAIEKALGIGPLAIETSGTRFDDRTEKNLATLLPEVEPVFREFVRLTKQAAAISGIQVKVISGTRSYAEQNKLFAKGRTKPGPKVTNARGGYSNHNFGIAIDLGTFSRDGRRYLDSAEPARASQFYREYAGPIARRLGLEWGGDWSRFKDEPHFQFATGLNMAQLRQRVAAGKAIV